ncbi:MAG: histidine kinase [Bacteroidales bacterium]|nr:histidine kinase [Bacteroidales bacterium]
MKHLLQSCALALFFSIVSLSAQPLITSEYNHRRYGISDGLPTEMVECMFQDSRGFMWFGAEHGVACFDGHTFRTYLADKSLPINKIEENEHGEIVIYGYYFIYLLNPKSGALRMTFKDDNLNYSVDKSPGLPKGYSLYTKRDVRQLALFHLVGDTLVECFSHPALAEMAFGQSIHYDTEAQLFYIPTQNSQIRIIGADGNEWAVLDNLYVCRFLKTNGDLLAIGNEGVWTVTPTAATLRFRFPQIIDTPAAYSDLDLAAVIDADGNLIIRDDKSVRRYRNNTFEVIVDNVNVPRALMFDREGNLWFTSRQGVYNFFKLDGMTYKVNAQNADIVYSIVPVASDELYFATGGGKLIHLKNNNFTDIPYPPLPDGTTNGFSYRAITVGDAIYFTSFSDILQYKNGKSRWLNIPPEIYHVASCRINDDEFAIGGWDKIFILNNNGKLLRNISHTNTQRSTFYTMQADDKNRLWIGSHKGISYIGDDCERYFFSENTMNGEASDKDPTGRIWFACESRIYHTDGDTIQLFMEFPNTIIGNLRYTRNNLIVISDNTGIKIIDPATKHTMDYNHTNGYSSGEPSWNTMTEDRDGNIWMGTQSPNVLKFNPLRLMQRSANPTLHLIATQYSDNNIEQHDMEMGAPLQHRQHNVHFSFVGLCFSNPNSIRYHYRLKGFQDDWSEPTQQREITFNNLSPGDYLFEIYADAGTDNSRSEIQSFAFSIKPAFWQTWWFLALCILSLMLASASVALYVQRRRNMELLQRLSNEKQLNELRIKSIRLKAIPHFNANVLSAIEYYIMNRSKEEANRLLGVYSNFTYQTLREVDKASRSLQEELDYVELYLQLEKLRFTEKFDYEISIDPAVDKTVQLPNMVLHTYCENAIKHAFASFKSGGTLKISAFQEDGIVKIAVEDNGVGRTAAAANTHIRSSKQGLDILKRQIEIYNRFNKQKITEHVIDLCNENGACGTRFVMEVPCGFVFQ